MKEIRIENYVRSRDYENRIIKIGNLGNHSKPEVLEIIVIMIIISDGINTRTGAWETEN